MVYNARIFIGFMAKEIIRCVIFLTKFKDNEVEEIKGLSSCHCLKKLSLVHNRIQRINGLMNLTLTHLNLVRNRVE